MSTSSTAQRSYTIREAAALTGLPASTLRYYESIGVIAPIGRGETSKQRVYSENDLDTLVWVACLSALNESFERTTGLHLEPRQTLLSAARALSATARRAGAV